MYCRGIVFIFFLLISNPFFGQLHITNTNVINTETGKVEANRTVTIENGKISSVSASSNKQLPGTVINGAGKFLIPGLADAHIHFFQSGGLYARPDVIDFRKHQPYEKYIEWTYKNMDDFLRRYLSIGITTVVDVGATVNLLKQRDSFATKNYAPSIFMTGPLLTTWLPPVYANMGDNAPFHLMKTEAEAREYVKKQLPYKPDFIKVWYIVTTNNVEEGAKKTLPFVKAVIDEAHAHGLKVAVHATERITAQLAVENGCDFLVHSVEDEVISNDFTKLLVEKNVAICPTLVVHGNYTEVFAQQYQISKEDHRTANPFVLGSLFDLRHLPDTVLIKQYKIYGTTTGLKSTKTADSIRKINLKKMMDAGVIIATGTDAGNIGTMHASSYYEELEQMISSGLTLPQILKASTINVAKMLGKEKEFGTVTPGKSANLVLLDANPLQDINNWKKINTVINKGIVVQHDSLIQHTPSTLAQWQLNAYNDYDVEAFLEPYSEDVEIYTFPNQLDTKGKDAMRKVYSFLNNTDLHCEVTQRIVHENTVIDYESIHLPGRRNAFKAIAIYNMENGKIKRVYFIQ